MRQIRETRKFSWLEIFAGLILVLVIIGTSF
jgi:hypothetical protein